MNIQLYINMGLQLRKNSTYYNETQMGKINQLGLSKKHTNMSGPNQPI